MKEKRNLIKGALQKRKEKEQTPEAGKPESPVPVNLKNFKTLSEMVGAFKSFELTGNFTRTMQGRILEEAKKDKRYKEMGYIDENGQLQRYNTFEQFCQKELKISSSKAYEIIEERIKIGTLAAETMNSIGLKPKDLKLILNPGDHTVDTSNPNVIEIDGAAIELTPDNKDIIQATLKKISDDKEAAIKALQETQEKQVEISKQLKDLQEKLNNPIPLELKEFQQKTGKLKTQIISTYSLLEQMAAAAKDDPKKFAHLAAELHYLDTFSLEIRQKILGDNDYE